LCPQLGKAGNYPSFPEGCLPDLDPLSQIQKGAIRHMPTCRQPSLVNSSVLRENKQLRITLPCAPLDALRRKKKKKYRESIAKLKAVIYRSPRSTVLCPPKFSSFIILRIPNQRRASGLNLGSFPGDSLGLPSSQ